MTASGFELICEIEPATTPDLKRVRHQIGVLSSVASSFLIPDNHIGRATVSSVAVAREVEAMGGRSIACLNAATATSSDTDATSSPRPPTGSTSSSASMATSLSSASGPASSR